MVNAAGVVTLVLVSAASRAQRSIKREARNGALLNRDRLSLRKAGIATDTALETVPAQGRDKLGTILGRRRNTFAPGKGPAEMSAALEQHYRA